jgi:hypothetical protein
LALRTQTRRRLHNGATRRSPPLLAAAALKRRASALYPRLTSNSPTQKLGVFATQTPFRSVLANIRRVLEQIRPGAAWNVLPFRENPPNLFQVCCAGAN